MKTFVQYIGYFTAFVGAAAIIWRVAVSFQKGEDRYINTLDEITELREEIVTKHDWRTFTDSVYNYNRAIGSELGEIKYQLNNLRKSYILYLRNDKSLTKDDFLQYMEGISFESKKKLIR